MEVRGEVFRNNICFDCFSDKVEYCSLNNAIFVCKRCAEEHSKLGKNISFLIKITTKLDPYLSVFIQRGGNDRLYKYLEQFNLHTSPILIKYKSFACEWYRRLLYSEVNCEEPPPKMKYENYSNMCMDSDFMEWNFDGFKFEEYKCEFPDQAGQIQDLFSSSISETNNMDNYRRNSFHQGNRGPQSYEMDFHNNNPNNNLINDDNLLPPMPIAEPNIPLNNGDNKGY